MAGLISWLRVVWLVATLPVVAAWLPLPGLGWLRKPLLSFAKRGKILQYNHKLSVAQRLFSHFYVVGILWTAILLVAVCFYAITILLSPSSSIVSNDQHVYDVWLSVVLLLLLEAQALRRYYESVKILKYSPSARMHIVGYFVGVIYYIVTPLSLCCNIAPQVFDFVTSLDARFKANGIKHMMSQSEFDIWMIFTPFLRLRWHVWIGAAMFVWGWVHQLRCHQILGSLRNKPENSTAYVIPYGDWFEYVSSPHYTAEIVINGGLLVASGGANVAVWLLFAFVVSNLGFAAMITHAWYLQKFDDYPKNRYALFPFVY